MSPSRADPFLSPALLEKYQALLRKHEALVRRLEERNTDHVSTWKLSSWGLETTSSGLALVRDGQLQMANRSWHAFAREPGTWRRLDAPDQPGLGLREAVFAEVQALLARPDEGPTHTRYVREVGDQTLEVRIERVRGPSAQPVRVLVLALDVTRQVRAERELGQARQALEEREHLRALGEMAAGVVHDLNNTLNAMRLRLELLQRDALVAERQRGNLDALMRIVGDAATRLLHLRDFSRQRPEQPSGEQAQLADVVREAVEIAQSDLKYRALQEGLVLTLDVDVPPLPQVHGSAAELRYVLINLLLNARDAMPRGGAIHVRGHVVGGQVELVLEDEGNGIPEQHLHSIFRPFFTTKGPKGTGLGLAMAYGVVSRAGGTITAANRARGGARFTLRFPPAPPPEPPASPRAPVRRRAPRRKKSPKR